MSITLTAVYRKVSEGYVGFIEELPGANTPGCDVGRSEREFEGGD